MIPHFPNFKPLDWSDKAAVEQHTVVFPPYSDFNFVSIWSWNTRNKMQVSELNGNLVLLFYDYVTEEPFLSFIGTHKVTDTAEQLITYSLERYGTDTLKLIPESVAKELQQTTLTAILDDTAHDYIISVAVLCDFSKHSLAQKLTERCESFLLENDSITIRTDSIQTINGEDCIHLFTKWAKLKNLDHRELNEYGAFERFLHNKENGNGFVCIYQGSTLIAFTTFEVVSKDYAICHFCKADSNYKNIYDVLYVSVARELHRRGIAYWNLEQDLGIPGLRQAKRKYKPVAYLKKYIVRQQST